MIEDFWLNALYSVTPTILVGLVFWFVLRVIVRADRTERAVRARIEAEERQRLGIPPRDGQPGAGAAQG